MDDKPVTKHEIDQGASDEEVARLTAKHDRLAKANDAKYLMLREKHGIAIPREAVEAKRMEFILDWMFPPGTGERLELETGWQAWIADQLEQVHAEVLEAERKAREEAKNPQPSILVPGKKLIVPGV